jgi:uncharacterized cupin superfamily protein
MKTTTELHHSNEEVMETGRYVCAAGETKEFKQGDKFPMCPRTGEATTWRHADHKHKSGDNVTESGTYQDADGERIELNRGDVFPNCPRSGNPTSWQHA